MADAQAGDTGLAGLERALRTALVSDAGPEALTAMDLRFAQALQVASSRAARKGGGRRIWRTLLAAAGLVVLGGAGAVVLQRFEGWSAPDFDVAWERAAVLAISQEVDGYEVTLERAYADAGQIMLATALEDLDRRDGVTQLATLLGNWTLVDDQGVDYPQVGGTTGPMSASESAELFYFEPPTMPLEPGTRHFTLTLDAIGVHEGSPEGATLDPAATGAIEVEDPWRMVDGPWVFEFDLDVAGGTFLEPDAHSAAIGGATIGVESMLVTPTRLRLGLRVEGLEDAAAWEPVGVTAERGSTTIPFGHSLPMGDGLTYAGALEGLDDPVGTWTFTIGELVGPALGPVPTPAIDGSFEDHSQRISGPWTVEVIVP